MDDKVNSALSNRLPIFNLHESIFLFFLPNEASIFLNQHIYFASLLAQPYWV
ncbi:hypothetical protein SCG7109_AA_00260 [Chlamydiales bacterium SCGC AG-110-M15]|nr:hypothetical protein SCG7109_AA_00260 [Chlamydiales bacterium SCGC AG-110-M15]